jgi:outer membrane protein assembly factor BamA
MSARRGRIALLALACLSLTARAVEPPTREPAVRQRPVAAHFSGLNPTTWPVVPVPYISVDPTSGKTFGIIPTWLQHDARGDIVRIIAPDIIRNTYFGWGGHARILDYPSADRQWSVAASMKQRVESSFDALYQTGLLRQSLWSLTSEADYDRSGTARFFGIGNVSPHADQTVYIDQQLWLQATLGWNITHAWQLAYTLLAKKVKVIGSTLPDIASITSRFPSVSGLGTTHEVLHRVSLTYDTRDDIRMPRHGIEVVVYGGIAGRDAAPTNPLFTEAGADGRFYWSPNGSLTIATHVDLRYMPSANAPPFWALSSIGGDISVLGGQQTLRGYGDSRFYDRDSFSANIELRRTIFALDTLGTHIDLQLAPFVDTGRVFSRSSTLPVDELHKVVGLGLRGVAAPFVVGYVDIGYGSEGAAVFTGIKYPF